MRSNHNVGALAGAWILCATMATASADTQTLCAISPSAGAGLQLNGAAAWAPSGGVRLVPDLLNQTGSVFHTAPVPFPTGTSFHAVFSLRMAPHPAGADGIGFVLQNSPVGAAALGNDGAGLGYQYLAHSVIVEFDTYRNQWDVNSNHVALMVDGDPSTHLALGTPPFALTASVDYAWVDYDGVAKRISVFVSQSPTQPASPMFSTTVDYGLHVGAEAFVGFTSATGSQTNNHDVLTWEFSTDGLPCACLGTSACPAGTPVCGLAGLCAQCAADADCGGPTPRCEIGGGVCVPCLSDTDCVTPTPVCDTTTFTCGPCPPGGGGVAACEPLSDAGSADGGAGVGGGAGGAGGSSSSQSGGGATVDAGTDAGTGGLAADGGGSEGGFHDPYSEGDHRPHKSGAPTAWSPAEEADFVGRCTCRSGPHDPSRGPIGLAALLGLGAWLRRHRRPLDVR